MRVSNLLAAALALALSAVAASPRKSAIIWFDDVKTPDSVIQDAKNKMLQAGATITHEYKLIRGFAVEAPEEALKMVQVEIKGYGMRVEEDGMMHADDGKV